MSDFHPEVVRIGKIGKHPNADSLSITHVQGCPVILRTGDFEPGDLAVYIPVDAIVPSDDPRFAFLDGHWRIRARRLRSIFSMGLLVKPDPDMREGEDVRERMRISKYEPPDPMTTGGDAEKDPGVMPVFTDIEGLRKWSHVLTEGEDVVLTEKLHGCNARFFHDGIRLWCGSHTGWKLDAPASLWWRSARENDLASKLANAVGFGFYGEVFGQVQDLKYGARPNQLFVRFFDVMRLKDRVYLDPEEAVEMCRQVGLQFVPFLHRGAWSEHLRFMAEGNSTLAPHCREGFVVRPVRERTHPELGRVILKMVGEGYHLRKGAP